MWNLCCYWAGSDFQRGRGTEQSQVSQFILFKFTTRGTKGCICVGESERREAGAATEQSWIIARTQDLTGYSQAPSLNKCKGEVHQEKEVQVIMKGFKNIQAEPPRVLSQLHKTLRSV